MFQYSPSRSGGVAALIHSRAFRIVRVVAAIFMVFLGLVGILAATPYYCLWRMRNAAANRDAETFCSYIDFPVLRENLKAELNAKILYEMQKDQKLKDNPFAGFAALAGPAMVNSIIDGYVTPAAIERSFKEGAPLAQDKNVASLPLNRDFLDENKGKVSSGYDGINDFWVIFHSNDGKAVSMVFERRALLSWQLAKIKFD